ncbi:MAG: hypothetical protein QF473_11115 [Planctomycetota bacterium]|nr:hypothetical protein [Planctomycetota bacterium]
MTQNAGYSMLELRFSTSPGRDRDAGCSMLVVPAQYGPRARQGCWMLDTQGSVIDSQQYWCLLYSLPPSRQPSVSSLEHQHRASSSQSSIAQPASSIEYPASSNRLEMAWHR